MTKKAKKSTKASAGKSKTKTVKRSGAAQKKTSKTRSKKVENTQTQVPSFTGAGPTLIANNHESMEAMMKQGTQQFEKMAQDAADFSREGFEAFQKSMSILSKGSEEFWKTAMSIAQTSAEKQKTMFKDAMASKTLNEWADAQNKMAQAQFDDFMANTTALSELSVKVLTESADPISQQVTKVMNKTQEAA